MSHLIFEVQRLTNRELNRALLARQGLLTRFDLTVVEAVEAIGALQAQYWPSMPVALWSRVRDFQSEALYRALEERELAAGSLLRQTLHLTSARQHPTYAAVVEAGGGNEWRRTAAAAPSDMQRLRSALSEYAQSEPRTSGDLVDFIEGWIERHQPALDQAELRHQRTYRWRPLLRSSWLVRVPADGHWSGARTPAAFRAAPSFPLGSPLSTQSALEAVIRFHLGAFGPAAPDDVASWIGWRVGPVRAALEGVDSDLLRFRDDSGRMLYDLPGAPRPGGDTPAPPRFLPWFDSVLLAYASRHRTRIVSEPYRDRVYLRANLQVLATFLVDGEVAGTWSVEARRQQATLTLRPFAQLNRTIRAALEEEGDRLLRQMHPAAPAHHVELE